MKNLNKNLLPNTRLGKIHSEKLTKNPSLKL